MIAAGKGWRRDRAGGEALGYCLLARCNGFASRLSNSLIRGRLKSFGVTWLFVSCMIFRRVGQPGLFLEDIMRHKCV